MAVQLALSTLMVLITVMAHAASLSLLGRLLRMEVREEQERHIPSLSLRALLFTCLLVLGLFALHGLEIWLYAALYLALGAVQSLESAVYFSTISYAAIGYGDSHILPEWRLLGAIEGINGVLLLGWSTAFFVTVVARLGRR
jgi:hypothetical protein